MTLEQVKILETLMKRNAQLIVAAKGAPALKVRPILEEMTDNQHLILQLLCKDAAARAIAEFRENNAGGNNG